MMGLSLSGTYTIPLGKIQKKQSEGVRFIRHLKCSTISSKIHSYGDDSQAFSMYNKFLDPLKSVRYTRLYASCIENFY